MSRGTPQVTLRLPPALWDEFGQAAADNDTDRSTLLRDWITDYVQAWRDGPAKTTRRDRR